MGRKPYSKDRRKGKNTQLEGANWQRKVAASFIGRAISIGIQRGGTGGIIQKGNLQGQNDPDLRRHRISLKEANANPKEKKGKNMAKEGRRVMNRGGALK